MYNLFSLINILLFIDNDEDNIFKLKNKNDDEINFKIRMILILVT